MGSISLRRLKVPLDGSKSLVGLPDKIVETCFVELSSEEREYYDQMKSEAQNTIREYINADTVLRNYSTVLYIILRLRQICNDLALCPSDFKYFLSSSSIEGNIYTVLFQRIILLIDVFLYIPVLNFNVLLNW